MALERGTLLHKRYRIVEILGQGGMGSVYRAVDENLGVEVAVKENLFTTDEYARQFRLEAVIMANLRHPNLPRVTDHFVIDEQGQYLVMDYIEGEDLRQRMERLGSISEEEAILIGAAMCDALTYLHTRKPPILHRDIKPGNVKITPEGHIFLVDFGLAKVYKGSQATTTGARAMTPGYSPPEQYGTARTDARTDVYSLGATLYAALTGIIPEDGLARAMDSVELTPLRKRNPRVSRRMATVIEKSMAVHAEDRYQSADEFKQALLSANVHTQRVEGEFVVTPPPQREAAEDIKEPPDKPITGQMAGTPQPVSHPRTQGVGVSFWVFLSFFLLTLLAGILGLILFWPPLSQAFTGVIGQATSTPPIPLTTAISTPSPAATHTTGMPAAFRTSTPTLTATTAPTATLTPSETATPFATPFGGGYGQIAFASIRTGIPQIFIMNLSNSSTRQLTSMPDGACQPDWSPDGTQVVFTSPCPERKDNFPDSSLYIINTDSNGLTPLPTTPGGDFDPAWSPDGKRIAFTSLRDGYPQVYVIYLEDQRVERLTNTTSDIYARQPSWAPSGSQIVYTVRRFEALQVWVMSDAGYGQTQLVRSGTNYWDFLPAWSPNGEVILFTQSEKSPHLGRLKFIHYANRASQASDYFPNGIYAIDASYSEDGQWIIFESTDSQNYDIYIMAADGTGRTRLTTDPAHDFDPDWRPAPKP